MDTPKRNYSAENEAFIDELRKLCRDRGHRAELRRYWSERTRHYAWPVLGRLRALDDERKVLVAALYAAHDKDGSPAHVATGPSVGSAFLRIAGGSIRSEGFDSAQRHFRRLLASQSLDELASQLHRLIKRLEQKSVPLDYARLLRDLRFWGKHTEQVKTSWSLDFWQANDETTQEESA